MVPTDRMAQEQSRNLWFFLLFSIFLKAVNGAILQTPTHIFRIYEVSYLANAPDSVLMYVSSKLLSETAVFINVNLLTNIVHLRVYSTSVLHSFVLACYSVAVEGVTHIQIRFPLIFSSAVGLAYIASYSSMPAALFLHCNGCLFFLRIKFQNGSEMY